MYISFPNPLECLLALRVVGVDRVAASRRAAISARETLSTTLAPHGSTITGGFGSSRLGCGGQSCSLRGGSGYGVLDGLRVRAHRRSTTRPDSWARHGESLTSVIDAEVRIGVGGLVGAGKLFLISFCCIKVEIYC